MSSRISVVSIEPTRVDGNGTVIRDPKLQDALDSCFRSVGVREHKKNVERAAQQGSQQTHWWDD